MPENTVSRRTIAKGALWSVPVIAVATAAPAFAASPLITLIPGLPCKYPESFGGIPAGSFVIPLQLNAVGHSQGCVILNDAYAADDVTGLEFLANGSFYTDSPRLGGQVIPGGDVCLYPGEYRTVLLVVEVYGPPLDFGSIRLDLAIFNEDTGERSSEQVEVRFNGVPLCPPNL